MALQRRVVFLPTRICSLFFLNAFSIFELQGGCSALMHASRTGDVEAVKLLLQAGANEEFKDRVRVCTLQYSSSIALHNIALSQFTHKY